MQMNENFCKYFAQQVFFDAGPLGGAESAFSWDCLDNDKRK